MTIDRISLIFYIVSVAVTIGGFAAILLAHSTIVLAMGVVMIVFGLVVFLVGQERTRDTAMVRRR